MRITGLFLSVGLIATTGQTAFAQDTAAGEKVFAKCKACHVVDTDKNKIGPSLQGLFGRVAGTYDGFKYSAPMIDAGKSGLTWDENSLPDYLKDPKGTIKGTKMAFVGLKKDQEILDVIAYLKQFSQ